MSDVKRLRVFFENVEADEPKAYCGPLDDKAEVLESIKNFLSSEVDDLQHFESGEVHFRLTLTPMSDEEIEALPDY